MTGGLERARATAGRRLVVEGARILRPGTDTFDGTTLTAGEPTVVWSGRASLGKVDNQQASGNGADDRLVGTRSLRIPADDTTVQIGDLVELPGWDQRFTVVRLDDRPTVLRVLQHLLVRASDDAPGVPA